MIRYLIIDIIINIATLIKIFHIKIIYRYNILDNIINNKDSIFTSVF